METPTKKTRSFGLKRFERTPESMLKQAYLTLSNASIKGQERLRLALIVSFLRGVYDQFRYVETQSVCQKKALGMIAEIIEDDRVPEDIRKSVLYWKAQADRWRQSKEFGIVSKDIADFPDDWTSEIEGLTPSQKLSRLMEKS
ncbi:hypothetical protein [Candidatus Macondimonas diazotrophica]|jgi:hypothetical protein|uniref:Uncharacterized protein n=1 Tax=Candidatus Macondimonas diazotrophica TaxID=2305248 RepID=A0A4Z0F5V1_9GAMM|nr:hypothetical protein [Candidatus Macondimonas diazotrophica]TFZ81620.1 hypothetical protein E4680_11600 [Candidatus Macondimonas diazotrophica]